MKTRSESLSIREIQFKTKLKTKQTNKHKTTVPTKMEKSKKTYNKYKIWSNKNFIYCLWECKAVQLIWKQSGSSLNN